MGSRVVSSCLAEGMQCKKYLSTKRMVITIILTGEKNSQMKELYQR